MGLTFVYPQKQCDIDSLIKTNGIYEKIGNKKLTGLVSVYELKNYKKRFLGNLVDGKKQGTWKEFHPNKRVLVENYNNGKLDGSVSLFYKNGQKEWRHTYNNGVLEGNYTRWHRNGKRAIDGFFEDGIPVGVWAWRDEKGNIIKKETFKRKEKGFLRDMKEYVDKEMIK